MELILNLLTDASGDSSVSGAGCDSNGAVMWIILGVLLVAMIVFNYFSRKKQQKAAEEKMAGLIPGSKIKTIGLICGTVISIDDVQNTVVIETGDGENKSYLTIDKSAIYQIFPEGSGVNGVSAVGEPDAEEVADVEENSSEEEKAEVDNLAEIDEIAEIDEENENGEN